MHIYCIKCEQGDLFFLCWVFTAQSIYQSKICGSLIFSMMFRSQSTRSTFELSECRKSPSYSCVTGSSVEGRDLAFEGRWPDDWCIVGLEPEPELTNPGSLGHFSSCWPTVPDGLGSDRWHQDKDPGGWLAAVFPSTPGLCLAVLLGLHFCH